jgi:hypothetical protein
MVLVSLLTDITNRREGDDGDWLADVRSWSNSASGSDSFLRVLRE